MAPGRSQKCTALASDQDRFAQSRRLCAVAPGKLTTLNQRERASTAKTMSRPDMSLAHSGGDVAPARSTSDAWKAIAIQRYHHQRRALQRASVIALEADRTHMHPLVQPADILWSYVVYTVDATSVRTTQCRTPLPCRGHATTRAFRSASRPPLQSWSISLRHHRGASCTGLSGRLIFIP
jgi:hypothetical protein